MREVLSGCAVRAEIQREKFTDAYLIDFLESDCLDLRCIITKYGMDDSDVGWEVIQHYQSKPRERRIGRGDTPREAIVDAIKTTEAELSRIAMANRGPKERCCERSARHRICRNDGWRD